MIETTHRWKGEASTPVRIACVLTHPIQYFSPWFRQLCADHPNVDLTVVYATVPDAARQGVGFGAAFDWDVPLLEGYPYIVLRRTEDGDDVHCSRFFGLDAPILPTLRRLQPDAVLVCGWHSLFQVRTLMACRRLGIPALYRGDTTLFNQPTGRGRSLLWRLKTQVILHGGFSRYLAVGTRSRHYLRTMGVAESRIVSSPHCIDNEFFANSAEAAKKSGSPKDRYALDGRFVALFAGKLEAVKRPADLLDALQRLGGDWAGLFVGAGPLEADLRRDAERRGVRAVFAGFHNQSEMGRAYAASDVLVLPSWSETWGLTVNEALACGVPCVVSDGVGCSPDLIEPGRTGEVFPRGDASALVSALQRVREDLSRKTADECRSRAAAHSFEAASRGLIAAAQAVKRRSASPTRSVVADCVGMWYVGGLERQSFQLLEVLRKSGRPVHVIGNPWAKSDNPVHPHAIKQLADRIGASWSFGCPSLSLSVLRRPIGALKFLAESLRFGRELSRAIQTTSAKTVLATDVGAVTRGALGLIWPRINGIRVVFRVGNNPERIPFYERVWGRVFPLFVDLFVANSEFVARRLKECGVPERKIRCVKNAVAVHEPAGAVEKTLRAQLARKTTLLCVGQIIPFKGPDVLLEAGARLLLRGYDFDIAFLGREPDWPPDLVSYFEGLKETAGRGVLENRVRFLGEVRNAQEVMKGAFLLVAPIVGEEAFGNVVLEGINAGVPCVVTPRGGLPELVDHQRTGFVCRDADAESLVEGIEWFLADPRKRRRAAAACEQAKTDPNWPYRREVYESAWLDVFANFDGGPRGLVESKAAPTACLRVVG